MFAEFLVWLALPALSSAPHLDGHHFSVNGASFTGPLRAWATTRPANPASATPAMLESFMECPPFLTGLRSRWARPPGGWIPVAGTRTPSNRHEQPHDNDFMQHTGGEV